MAKTVNPEYNSLFSGMKSISNNTTTNDNLSVRTENADIIYKTKKYDIFLPYPKEELRLSLHTGPAREALKNSIAQKGITTPIKVAKLDGLEGKYVILGGHNRLDIAKELGIEVPYMVFNNLTEEQKDDIVAEEHILNRQTSDLKPSQIMKLLIAIKNNNKSQKELITTSQLPKTSVYRYLSLSNLYPSILYNLVDEKKISIMSAESMSKISIDKQSIFYEYLSEHSEMFKTSIPEKPLKNLLETKEELWSKELFEQMFVVKNAKLKIIKLDSSQIARYLTDEEQEKPVDIIIEALKEYHQQHHQEM